VNSPHDVLELRNPDSLPDPVGLYSHVAVASQAGVAFIAGQLAVDEDGAMVGVGDIDAQIERCFRNVGLVLESLGAGWGNLAKMTTYVTSPEAIGDFYRVREKLYAELFPGGSYPPNTLLVVSRLVRPEFQVEIEGMAVLP
jgi:2-iminobutanoate/2-iminopropanoate deaminase